MSRRRSVLVRGAGVVGLCCATTLAERGAAVVVVEAGPRIGSGASWKAGGMLAPWCEAETAPPRLQEMAAFSLGWWRDRLPDTAFNGTLVLAPSRDARELDRFARRTSHFRTVNTAELGELEPDLAERFSRGLFFDQEGHLDPRSALTALATRAEALGGKFYYSSPSWPADGFDDVVDARGMGAASLLPDLRGVRGEMLLVRCRDITLQRPIRLLHPRHPIYIVPRLDHIFMIGATMIETGDASGMRLQSAVELMNAAYAVHPAFGDAELLEFSADVRPSLGQNMPTIHRDGRTFVINGMYRHGFLLAPVLAHDIACKLTEQ